MKERAPVDMLLYCPECEVQHIDEPKGAWTNPPHKKHLCLNCGHLWKPFDYNTNGVRSL